MCLNHGVCMTASIVRALEGFIDAFLGIAMCDKGFKEASDQKGTSTHCDSESVRLSMRAVHSTVVSSVWSLE